MKTLFKILAEIAIALASVAVFCFVIDPYQAFRRIVPFMAVPVGGEHFNVTAAYFGTVLAVLFGLSAVLFGPVGWSNPRRLAKEIHVFAAGLSISAFAVFLTSRIGFSAHLFLGVSILSIVGLLGLGLLSVLFTAGIRSALGHLFQSVVDAFRLLRTAGGIASLLVICAPVVLAGAYAKNRDVANAVARVRMFFSEPIGDLPYVLVNAFPGVLFFRPIAIQYSPADANVAYVLERGGALYRLRSDGTGKELMLDIGDQVGIVDFENGALGFDLHPDFGVPGKPQSGWCFIYYTSVQPGKQENRLSRFDLSLADAAARKSSETPLLVLGGNDIGFHNGGSVEFGTDRFLYLGIGEASDHEGWQKIDRSLFGGVIRIDVDQTGGDVSHEIARQPFNGTSANYFIPNDNPFPGRGNVLEEFFAIGLRNPFRLSFDPANQSMWVGDVGSLEWEEVNLVKKGHNYQYPFIEGTTPTNRPKPSGVIGVETPPVHFYHHTANDRSVIGGSVYRGNLYPELAGRYIFGDNYSGKIWAIPATGEFVEEPRIIARAKQLAQRGITSLVNAPDGRFLIITLGAGTQEDGRVWALVPAGSTSAEELKNNDTDAVAVTAESTIELFNSVCARCHGVDGKANGHESELLGGRFPNFASEEFHAKRTDGQIHDVIRDGAEKHGLSGLMVPFGDIFTEPELNLLVEHVRSLRKPDGGPEYIEYPKPKD